MVKFIVLTTQRSGATFFIKCLDSHPQIECRHQSIFGQVNKFKLFSVDRPSSPYFKYRSSSPRRQIAHWFQREKLVYGFLTDLYARPYNATAVGFKVSYSQAEKYPAIVAWLKEHDVRIIHFVRDNLLKRFVSHETARKRKLYHSTQKVVPVKIHLPIRKLEKELRKRTQLIKKYKALFSDEPYLEVSYESFVADQGAETRQVLQFLDINQFAPLTTDQVKINPDSLEDIIENYEEVKQTLSGTAFEKFLT